MRRCIWYICTWKISLKTKYPSSQHTSCVLRCPITWIPPWTEPVAFCCCCIKPPQPCLTDIFIKFLWKHVFGGFFLNFFFKHTHTQPSSESSKLTPHVLLRFPKHWGLENMFPISSHLSLLVFYSAPCWGGPDPGNLQGRGWEGGSGHGGKLQATACEISPISSTPLIHLTWKRPSPAQD